MYTRRLSCDCWAIRMPRGEFVLATQCVQAEVAVVAVAAVVERRSIQGTVL